MDRQEGEKEDHSKGVRRPRSDAARRPRPHSGFPAATPASGPPSSHTSYDSYREPQSGHPISAHDRSTERGLGDIYSDVMEVGGSRNEGAGERREHRKDDKYYSRKEHHSNPLTGGRNFGRGDRVQGEGYEGESRGGRDDYSGRARPHDSRSIREEKGPRYGGNRAQDDGKESGNLGSERREDGRSGREEERVGNDKGERFAPRREEYRDSRFSARKENFSDRRFQRKDDSKQERGDWRESSGTKRPEHERGKRLEKSMKDIVDTERPMKEHVEDHHGEGRNHERNKSGRWREREDHERGKERLQRDMNQTQTPGSRERHASREPNFKPAEKEPPEQKAAGFTKLKLKVGGVTRTVVPDSVRKSDAAATLGTNLPPKVREPDGAGTNKRRRHRLILQEQSDDDEETGDLQIRMPPSKALKKSDSSGSLGSRGQTEVKTGNGDKTSSAGRSGEYIKTATFASESSVPAVRKSSRVPKRRVLDGDEEDAEHANLQQKSLGHIKGGREVEEEEDQKEELEAEEENWEEAGATVGEESYEGLGDGDDEGQGAGMVKRGKVQLLHTGQNAGTGVTLTARQRAMQTSRDADKDSGPSLIEFPDGLTNPFGRKGKSTLSEAERQVKKVEAAHRRKQQVEKAAREIQATAIQKILGQDSTRKRRENRLEKQRQDIEEEKKAAELAPSSNSIRWNLGPLGSVVSFAEDVGLPGFFNSGLCRYPPPREKCAAPTCTNTFKYRDSKSNVPLCSLQCYRVVHHAPPVASAH